MDSARPMLIRKEVLVEVDGSVVSGWAEMDPRGMITVKSGLSVRRVISDDLPFEDFARTTLASMARSERSKGLR